MSLLLGPPLPSRHRSSCLLLAACFVLDALREVRILTLSTFEGGCGKTTLNGMFAVADHDMQAYVQAVHNVLGASDVVAALRDSSSSYCVSVHIEPEPELAGCHKITNISIVNHVEYLDDGELRAYRHAGVGPGQVLSREDADRCACVCFPVVVVIHFLPSVFLLLLFSPACALSSIWTRWCKSWNDHLTRRRWRMANRWPALRTRRLRRRPRQSSSGGHGWSSSFSGPTSSKNRRSSRQCKLQPQQGFSRATRLGAPRPSPRQAGETSTRRTAGTGLFLPPLCSSARRHHWRKL